MTNHAHANLNINFTTDETIRRAGDDEKGAEYGTRKWNRTYAYGRSSGAPSAAAACSVGDTPDITIANIKVVLCSKYLIRRYAHWSGFKNWTQISRLKLP